MDDEVCVSIYVGTITLGVLWAVSLCILWAKLFAWLIKQGHGCIVSTERVDVIVNMVYISANISRLTK